MIPISKSTVRLKKAVRPLKTKTGVYELQKNSTFFTFFNSSVFELDKLCFTQHQIKKFIQSHRSWLRTGGYATFFLFKSKLGPKISSSLPLWALMTMVGWWFLLNVLSATTSGMPGTGVVLFFRIWMLCLKSFYSCSLSLYPFDPLVLCALRLKGYFFTNKIFSNI
jgi:hypothetical protein